MGERILEYVEVRRPFPDEEDPEIKPGEMHVYYKDDIPEFVNFICPCGCGNECPTRIRTETRTSSPIWTFSNTEGRVSLSPSIRWTGGCRAHFFITNGKTDFCGDSGN